MEGAFLLSASFSVFITISIVIFLSYEAMGFFKEVSIKEFLTEKQWTPLFANPKFGILPLITGTLLISVISLTVALPLGIIIAVYLSEYANYRIREILKPLLELLAGVPTVVYGYFALLFLTPLLKKIIPEIQGFNALSPGIIIGIMIIPYISSLSEDVMKSVPMHIKEGSYAMGATKFQTAFKVVIPASFSGISAAFIMGISRAIGETMVVSIAAGMMPNLTLNPIESVQAIPAFIVQISLGDAPHGTIEYKTIFAAGITLFLLTLFFNLIGAWLKKRIRESY
ncbi:MAG: phosphate ABC transporter permease subunit PstC [Acidobacteriota bacterium]